MMIKARHPSAGAGTEEALGAEWDVQPRPVWTTAHRAPAGLRTPGGMQDAGQSQLHPLGTV